jgi:hypothetical protein
MSQPEHFEILVLGREAGWGDPACPVPAAFSTHGLFVSQRPDGHVQIIAVNHTGRESIEDGSRT